MKAGDKTMSETKIEVCLPIKGMTCTGCEDRVTQALQNIGAMDVTASFKRGEAKFHLNNPSEIKAAMNAVSQAGYAPGKAEIIQSSLNADTEYDLVVIGSGAAAFSAAIEATKHEAKILMVERGTIGGTCVNIGCVPSKTLLRAGEINHFAQHNTFAGLDTSAGAVDLSLLIEQKNALVSHLRQRKYIDLIKDYGFDLIQGEARFVNETSIEVNGQKIRGEKFIIATGASPAIPDIPGLHDIEYLTSTSALDLQEVPKKLTVIGAGFIAMELGQLFHSLGSEVTLMQRNPRFLKNYDPEIAEAVKKTLIEQNIRTITNAVFERVEQDGTVKRIFYNVNGESKTIESNQILVATGRVPNTAQLNLEAAGVNIGSRKEVLVDKYLQTSNPNIYAAGDVTMGPQFVYVAAYEGAIAAKNALGANEQAVDLQVVPAVTFTHPSIATVGLTEDQAKQKGYEVKTSLLPLDAVPRAIVNRETTGVFKLVADAKTSKLLGVHLVAENAGDVIYAAVLAVKFGLTIDDMRGTLAPYLTMAEGLKLASLTFDKDVSKLSCCAG